MHCRRKSEYNSVSLIRVCNDIPANRFFCSINLNSISKLGLINFVFDQKFYAVVHDVAVVVLTVVVATLKRSEARLTECKLK